ncbi:MAG: matrixin family metalloprotease [Proteobacteria bacterium]|nr:matrixin family metalloprotease [Pseudomonadota bacterium]
MNRLSSHPYVLLSLIAVWALTSVPVSSYAWKAVKTDSGTPTTWDENCFYYTIHQDGVPGLDFDEVSEEIRLSFEQWADVSCSYFKFEETAPASCPEVGFNEDGGNMNLLVWQTDPVNWEWGSNVIAMTPASYDLKTGRILDADIEFNAISYSFNTTGEGYKVDVRNTVTHEIGHMMGLDHSEVPESTMAATADTGETSKRKLHSDDIEGLCTLYPIEDDPGKCKEPICGLNLDCVPNDCKLMDELNPEAEGRTCASSVVLGAARRTNPLSIFVLWTIMLLPN